MFYGFYGDDLEDPSIERDERTRSAYPSWP
jgi:hypothetical protein